MKPDFADFASISRLTFRPTTGQVYAELGGELAILDSKSGVYYGLDPVGARVWSLILEWKTGAEIRATLLEEYDVEPAQLDGDILHLFNDLMAKGLIEVAPPGSRPRPSTEESVSEFR